MHTLQGVLILQIVCLYCMNYTQLVLPAIHAFTVIIQYSKVCYVNNDSILNSYIHIYIIYAEHAKKKPL